MLPTKFGDFFQTANLFFATIGIQLSGFGKHKKFKKFITRLQFIIQFFCVNCMLGGEVIYVLMALRKQLYFLESIMTLAYIGFTLVGEIKMIVIFRRKEILNDFLKNLLQIFPSDKKQQKLYKVKSYMKICKRINRIFALLYMTGVWTYNLFPVMEHLIYDRWLKMREVPQDLPYFMFVMWQWQDHWTFYVLYIGEMLAAYSAVAGQVASDLLMTDCAIQLVMHFDYLERSLENCEPEKNYENVEFLKNFVKYHSYLLQLSHQLNIIFGVPLLLNFISNCFITCFLGFHLTLGSSPLFLFKLLIFFSMSVAQVFLICKCGQKIQDASFNISKAAYNNTWLKTTIKNQKVLLFIAQRAQHSFQLKATSCVNISFYTFAHLLQISYKFFALLRTLYLEK